MTTPQDFAQFNGKRVETVTDIDNFPTGYFRAGLTGTCKVADDCFWIKLDQRIPALDEWENELQIWDWEAQDGPDYAARACVKVIDA